MSYVWNAGVLGDASAPCPPGQHSVCMLQPPGATTPAPCTCRNDPTASTAAASAAQHHWGLFLGIGLGAIVVVHLALS